MAVVSLRTPTLLTIPGVTTVNTQVLDATNDGIAYLARAPKAGTINAVGFNVTARATPPNYRVALETGTSVRQPNGVILASGNAFVDVSPGATGWTWQTLGTGAVVAAGDRVAGTVRYQSGTIGASNNITIAANIGGAHSIPHGYVSLLTAGTWAANTAQQPAMALRYSDGTVIGQPYSSITNQVWNSTSNPRYRAMCWTPAADVTVSGVVVSMRPGNTTDFEVLVYEGTSGTPLATVAVDADVDLSSIAGSVIYTVRFATPLQLTAGAEYRFVVNPTSTSSFTTWARIVMPDAGSYAAWGLGDFKRSSTNSVSDPITWDDFPNEFDPIIPVLDGVDLPAGGGSPRRVLLGG